MYRRAQTHLNCPPRLQSGRSRTHLACRRSGKCPVALVRVDSTFIGAVSQPNFRRPHRTLGVYRSTQPDSNMSALLVSPQHRPVPRSIAYFALEAQFCRNRSWCTSHLLHCIWVPRPILAPLHHINFSSSNRVPANISLEKQTA